MKDPIFILGCTKSGTTLMRNLFSGHKDLFVVPFESHFFQNISYWIDYYFRRTTPKYLSMQDKKSELINWIIYMNQTTNKLADSFVEGKFDIERLKNYFKNHEVETIKELSDLYIKGIYYSLMNKEMSKNISFVEKSVENVELCNEWLDIYPNAKFIHILRNPYSNIVAIRKYLVKTRKEYPFLLPAVSSMKTSYYYLYKNLNNIKNYKIVIYEELLKSPQKTMKNISEFLDINYEDNLTIPTHLNEIWSGNSTNNNKFKGISAKNIDVWKAEISELEISFINKSFLFLIDDFGFERIRPKSSIYWPQKNEGLRNYIGNRFIYKTF